MNIVWHEDIEKDLRNLRRFQAPLESLEAWERLFCLKGLGETPAIDPFPGFGERKIYKARVVSVRRRTSNIAHRRNNFSPGSQNSKNFLIRF